MVALAPKASRETLKQHNSRLVLSAIFHHQPISRAEIARLTGLTITTVSNLTATLIASGLVDEGDARVIARGKPPTPLHVRPDAFHLVCLDLARSAFQGSVISLQGEILHQASLPLQGQMGDEALALVHELIDSLLASTNRTILGVGIGAPGIIDPDLGVVRRAVNFGWYDVPLRDLLVERYSLPIHIANASHTAVLAEQVYGHFKQTSDLVVVKVGYDIGAGIFLNGQLLYGHGFGAGEIGHVVVVENGEQCRCGHCGCLETVVSSRAIVRRAQSIAREHPESLLNQTAAALHDLDIRAVVEAFAAGDELLRPVVDEVGAYLGIAAANLVGVLSVPYVLIAGSVAEFGQPLIDRIRVEMNARCLAPLVSQTRVELASLGPDIVVLGAAALLLQREMGVL